MNNQKNNKTIIVVIGVIVLVGLLITFLVMSGNKKPSKAIKYTDKDTGETLITEPNKTPENYNNKKDVLVLGSPALIEKGLTTTQYDLFKQSVIAYTIKNFSDVTQVKILPDKLSGEGNNINGVFKLGETSRTLNFSVKAYDLNFIELTIEDPTNKVGVFNSGKLGTAVDDSYYPEEN